MAPRSEFEAIGEIGRTCDLAADGRRAARALSQWCGRFQLSEPEFQVLWCLCSGMAGGRFDQTALAKRLAFSAAQVCVTVERLRFRGWIEQQSSAGDRRRNVWCLSAAGSGILGEMLQAASDLHVDWQAGTERAAAAVPKREAAA
jgi:DNA-binding MarR family transcriptional regulator